MAAQNKKLYWPPAVTVDVVIFTVEDEKLKVLLVKRENEPFRDKLALPGGFSLKNEATQKAALRILKEKAGVRDVFIEQLYTFDSLKRDPRGHILTVTYFSIVPRGLVKFDPGRGRLENPAFYPVGRLSDLAFDHKKIINYAIQRLQAKLEYTNVVFSLLPKYFTLSELQKTYEMVLDKKLDKRNFRKKFLFSGLIKVTKKVSSGTRQRPARLYESAHTKPTELKKFF